MRSIFVVAVTLVAATASPAIGANCSVSDEERQAASQLDWESFDQTGGTYGSFRDLVAKGCHHEAIEAYRAWLRENHEFPSGRAKGIGMFHIGQSLAFTGNSEGAMTMFEQPLRDEQAEGQVAIDWNIYVDGVQGFFARDVGRIDDAITRLGQSDRGFARRQSIVLSGFKRCLRRPYAEAMSAQCRS